MMILVFSNSTPIFSYIWILLLLIMGPWRSYSNGRGKDNTSLLDPKHQFLDDDVSFVGIQS